MTCVPETIAVPAKRRVLEGLVIAPSAVPPSATPRRVGSLPPHSEAEARQLGFREGDGGVPPTSLVQFTGWLQATLVSCHHMAFFFFFFALKEHVLQRTSYFPIRRWGNEGVYSRKPTSRLFRDRSRLSHARPARPLTACLHELALKFDGMQRSR